MAEIDYSDPCAVAALLRAAYYQLLAGAGAQRVHIENREVQFAATDIDKLRGEIARLDSACAAQRGEARPPLNINVRSKGWR